MGLLDRILATKKAEVAGLHARAEELHARSLSKPGPRDFVAALRAGESVTVVAEVKRRSPSAGAISVDADPVETATGYASGGAAAISVLTDAEYFGGSLADLKAVTSAVGVPVLRKDFTIDALQIVEARGVGASAVLLIVRLLTLQQLQDLRGTAEGLGLTAVVEVHDAAELHVALDSGARVIGINNRNLDTLEIDLAVSELLLPLIPADCIALAESGIRDVADVERLAAAGADAVLVGESLMRHGSPEAGVAALGSVPRVGR